MLDLNGSAGFQPLDSEACKPQSSIAQESVLRMVLPSSNTKTIRELVGDDNLETRRKLIEEIRKDAEPPPSTNDINVWQIENCIKDQTAECAISMDYRSSTIVLTGDGANAATAFHNLKLYMAPVLAKAKRTGKPADVTARSIGETPIHAFFYRSDGKAVAQPNDLRVRMNGVTSAQVEEAWKDLETKAMPTFADTVTLTFSRSIGKGVKTAVNAPAVGETVKIFGFPDRTQAWAQAGGTDSDGKSMYCTVGPTLSIETAASRFNWKIDTLPIKEHQQYRNGSVFTASPSYGGMSGGAVLNNRGELVATHSSGGNSPNNPTTANSLLPSLIKVK